MSKEAVELVLGKVLLEADFRLALLADPDRVLAGFALNAAEKSWLKRIDSETLESLACLLHGRISTFHQKAVNQ